MNQELFVANLDWNVNEDELYGLFAQYGEVVSARIPVDRQTGRKRGFAFVQMATPEHGQDAVNALNNWELKGRPLVVKFAEPREAQPHRPRSGDHRYRGHSMQPRGGDYRHS